MNKLFIVMALFMSVTHADLSVNQIRDMVTKIHQQREGIQLKTLQNTKEPFVRLSEENNITTFVIPVKAEEQEKLRLHAILNEKAYINDEWKSIDDIIGGYKLKYVGKKGVVLRNENQIKKLFLHEEKENFIIVEGRE